METFINALICINVIVMIVEADHNAQCVDATGHKPTACRSHTLEIINFVFLVIYTMEAIAKLFIHRLSFFYTKYNCLDLFVVTTGLLTLVLETAFSSEDVPNLQMLRMCRILRLARNIRIVRFFPELQKLVNGFICAMSAMAWGLILILLLLVFFAIVTVEVVHPVNVQLMEQYPEEVSTWCAAAFDSVFHAALLYFQTLVAGDAWGGCIVPLIRFSPLVAVIFIAALACVQLAFLNLILSVVVDSAASSRESDREKQLRAKRHEEAEAVEHLREVIRHCDTDGSGEVTLDELKDGFQDNEMVEEILGLLDIRGDDIEDMFHLMDLDGSGTLSYDEFIDCIRKAEMQDTRVQLMLLSLQMQHIRRNWQNYDAMMGIDTDGAGLKFTSGNSSSSRAPVLLDKSLQKGAAADGGCDVELATEILATLGSLDQCDENNNLMKTTSLKSTPGQMKTLALDSTLGKESTQQSGAETQTNTPKFVDVEKPKGDDLPELPTQNGIVPTANGNFMLTENGDAKHASELPLDQDVREGRL